MDALQHIKEKLGFHLVAKINLVSDERDVDGTVTYSFGPNSIPTTEQVNKAIHTSIKAFNEQLGSKDARLITDDDLGIALGKKFEWDIGEPPAQKSEAEEE